MIFIGDVHGEFSEYGRMCKDFGGDPSIQLGDMGIGFRGDSGYGVPYHHMFIRGNHDNPQKCRQIPNYLGDYGYFEQVKEPSRGGCHVQSGIFFVSGAASPDFFRRIPHVNWWEDEQLTKFRMDKALELYAKVKPKIVATHDCPLSLLSGMYSKKHIKPSATGKLFDTMLEVHRPEAWMFAHHHKSLRFSVSGTEFFGLRILEAIKIDEHVVQPDYRGEDECES